MKLKSLILLLLMLLSACSEQHHVVIGSDGYGLDSSLEPRVLADIVIDDLRIRHVRRKETECISGFYDHLEVVGRIGPDSTAALERILPSLQICTTKNGTNILNSVYLSSGGGLLFDGFELGRLFRKHKMSTRVTGGQKCSSSCAIAFLGGYFRGMNGNGKLIFHAPYVVDDYGLSDYGLSEYGLSEYGLSVDCSDRGQVSELRSYYIEMLGHAVGEFLLNRTMQYCSSSEGWTINADAAELFGILN